MAKYKADLEDLEFNLFQFLSVQNHTKYGLGIDDMKGIILEFEKFVANEIFASREESDRVGVHLVDGLVKVPECLKKFHKSFYDNGWFGIGLSDEIGGTPVPEAVAYATGVMANGANTGYMMYPGLSKAALNVIHLKGTDEQKQTYLGPMMEGLWGGTMCLTEAGAGSDVGALRTTATPNEDGSYNIKGIKIFISSGESDLYENNIHLVLARTPGAADGTKGISLFIVPRFLVNADGSVGASNNVICTKVEEKMGIHASATCELTFGDGGVSKGWLIGEEFEGMPTMFIMMNEARLLCGIQGQSQGTLAYHLAHEYAKERSQFGKEILKHPDVKKTLLKMRAAARGMTALCLYTAEQFNQVESDPAIEGLIGLLTPICKAYCSEEGLQVSIEAVQVHGGYGYCTEYGVEQFVRDSLIAKIYEGTNGIQAIDFVMRKIVKDQGKSITKLLTQMSKWLENLEDTYAHEKEIFGKCLMDYQAVLQKVNQYVTNQEFDNVLELCTDLLFMSSHLIVAWLLGQQSQKALGNAEVDQNYAQTKRADFQIYCQYFLTKNLGLAWSVRKAGPQIAQLEL